MNPETELGGRERRFPTTAVSIFHILREGAPEERRQALQRLVALYWKPVYCYIRYGWQKGNEDAKDLTQEFFLDTVFEGALAEKFAPDRGSFRALLKASVSNFMRDAAKAARRRKRGGDSVTTSFDMAEVDVLQLAAEAGASTPDEVFDAAWKHVVMSKAVDRIEGRLRDQGKESSFEVFRRYELDPAGASMSYAEMGSQLGMTPDRVKHALTAVRQELRRAVLETVSEYVGTEEGLRVEMKELFGV